MKPIISIIVPVYNVESCLKKCIDSILNQTFKEFELILVNDGSTDKSGDICEKYALKDERIKVVHKKNTGQGSARNTGLDLAIGKYIGFVDSDDCIHEKMYEELIKKIKNRFDLALCGRTVINKDNEKLYLGVETKEYYFDAKNNIDYLCHEFLFPHTVSVCNKIYKKSLIEKLNLRFEDVKIIGSEDTLFNCIYILNATSLVAINKNYYIQMEREGSTTRSYRPGYLKRFGNLLNRISLIQTKNDFIRVKIIFCIYFLQFYIKQIKIYSLNEEFYLNLFSELNYLRDNKEFKYLVKEIVLSNVYINDLKKINYSFLGIVYIKLLYMSIYLKLSKLVFILLK